MILVYVTEFAALIVLMSIDNNEMYYKMTFYKKFIQQIVHSVIDVNCIFHDANMDEAVCAYKLVYLEIIHVSYHIISYHNTSYLWARANIEHTKC